MDEVGQSQQDQGFQPSNLFWILVFRLDEVGRIADEKRKQWEAIKAEAPDVAGFVVDVSRVFGKPAALRVELPSGMVVESGRFDPVRFDWDGRLRVSRYG